MAAATRKWGADTFRHMDRSAVAEHPHHVDPNAAAEHPHHADPNAEANRRLIWKIVVLRRAATRISGISRDTRTRHTSMRGRITGWDMRRQTIGAFTWTILMLTAIFRADLAPGMFGIWRAGGQAGSGLTAGTGALLLGRTPTSAIGCGARIRSSSMTIPTIRAGISLITQGSAPTLRCNI